MEVAKRILLAEDDVLIARIYRPRIEQAGFQVVVAEDGLAAMKHLKEFIPALVVLDLMMPKLNGLDVLKYIRSQPELKATPVIVFSNGFLQKLWDETSALGVQEMLLKAAATPSRLLETISRILNPNARAPATPVPGVRSEGDQPVSRTESASNFRERIRRDFFQQIPVISKGLERACGEFLEANKGSLQTLRLEELRRKVGFLTHMTGMAGCYRIAQLSSAFEALLFELHFNPATITDSSRHTTAAIVGLLIDSLSRADEPDEQCLSPTSILVVDDDAVSSRALALTLERARLRTSILADPLLALEKLRHNSYDLAILDINLPGMTGINLCEQMRQLPLHAKTPVIFITSYREFEPLARSILKAGDDLIGKPIMPVELTVKVIAHLLRRRIQLSTAGA
jgi:DNA-binding response OmpR family regulator